MKHTIRLGLLCALGIWFVGESLARAATTSWNTGSDGVFTVASNWTGGVPGSADTAVFRRGNSAAYTVSVNGGGLMAPLLDHKVDRLVVGGNTVTLQRNPLLGSTSLTAGNATTTPTGRGIVVGELAGDTAVLNSSVLMTAVAATIGDAANSTGTWNVSGSKVTLTAPNGLNSNLIVGNGGTGTLNLTNGASFVVNSSLPLGLLPGSNGTLSLSGAGTNLTGDGIGLIVGDDGTGTLSVSSGADLNVGALFLGFQPGSSGNVAIVSSTAETGTLQFGSNGFNAGAGSMLSQGSQVQASAVNVNGSPGATAFLNIVGGNFTVTDDFTVGQTHNGTTIAGTSQVNIQSFATVSNQNAFVACPAGSTCLVQAQQATWNINGNLDIAVNDLNQAIGAGSVSISIDGKVNVAGDTTISTGGSLKLSRGTFASSNISLAGGNFNWLSGTLHVGVFNASLNTPIGGILAPGADQSAGSTVIVGDYSQHAGGTLQIEVGGHSAGGDYDLVGVTGHAILGGDLELDMLNGFVPSATDTFTVLTTGGGIFGVFDNVTTGGRLATADGLGSFIVNFGAGSAFNQNQIVLSGFLAVALPGEFNHNGVVDMADYVIWRNNAGTSNALVNDTIGGVVGQAQYNEWRANFGMTVSGGAAVSQSTAVPEPSWVMLTLVAFSAHGVVGCRVRYSLAHRTAE